MYHLVLNKQIKLNLDYVKCFVKPAVASLVMGIVVAYSYDLVHSIVSSNAVSTLISICVGGGVYGICILLLRAFSNDELVRLPVVGGIFKRFIKEKNV